MLIENFYKQIAQLDESKKALSDAISWEPLNVKISQEAILAITKAWDSAKVTHRDPTSDVIYHLLKKLEVKRTYSIESFNLIKKIWNIIPITEIKKPHLNSLYCSIQTIELCIKKSRKLARTALLEIRCVMNSLKKIIPAAKASKEKICEFFDLIERTHGLISKVGKDFKRTCEHQELALKRFEIPLLRLTSEDLKPKQFLSKLNLIPHFLPAIEALTFNDAKYKCLQLLSLPLLLICLKLPSKKLLERSLINANLKTVADLKILFQEHQNSENNVIQILRIYIDQKRDEARQLLNTEMQKQFDYQWTFFTQPEEAWDYLSQVTYLIKLAKEKEFFQRMYIYKSYKGDYFLFLNLNSDDEAILFKTTPHNPQRQWKSFWSPDGETFYPDNTINDAFNFYPFIVPWFDFQDTKRNRWLGFYERLPIEDLKKIYEGILQGNIQISNISQPQMIFKFHHLYSLQDLIINSFFYSSKS